jgi:hypothetical protein
MAITDILKNAALGGIKNTLTAYNPVASATLGALSTAKNTLFNNPSNSAKSQISTLSSIGTNSGLNSGQKNTGLSQPNPPSTPNNYSYGSGEAYSYTTPSTPDYGSGNYNFSSANSVQGNNTSANNYNSNDVYKNSGQTSSSTTSYSNPYNDQLKALQDKINSLNDSFSGYLKPSDQETQTQQQLDALTSQQRNLAASEALGLSDIQSKPIALGFQQGQSAALQRQAAAQLQALRAQAEPLNTQLARLQSQRQQSADLAKYQLGNIQNEYTNLQGQSKPIEVGGNLVRLNPATGQYETLFSPSGKNAEGFTLSEGQQRYDAKGNLLASGAPKTQEELTNDIKNYNFAKSQGYGGSFTDFQNSGGSGGSLPSAYREYQLSQNDPGFANYLQGSKPLTPDQLKAADFASRLQSSDQIINQLAKVGASNVGGISQYFPNVLKSSDRQQLEQAERTFVNAVLRRESGAAISPSEFNSAAQQYFPQPGDSQATIQQKANLRAQVTQNLQNQAGNKQGNTSQINPQELQQLRSAGYSDQQIQQFLGQRGFNQPVSSGANSSGSIRIPQSSTLAYVNNNPGNLRFVGQAGAVPGRGGFAKFESPEAGYQALKNQIQIRVNQGKTLASFIGQYAPPSENDTNGYINIVSRQLGVNPNTPLKQINLDALARAVAQHESSTKIG